MPHWLDIVLRSLFSLLYLFLLTKLIGKRQLTQMTVFEYIAGITVGDIAAFIATNSDGTLLDGVLALTLFALFPVAMGWLTLKSKRIQDFVDGHARVLIKNGKVLEKNLQKERITPDELMEQLRMKGAFKLADVEFAVMEPSGAVSVMLNAQNQPLTPAHLNLQVAPLNEPQAVIMDGKIIDESLSARGFTRRWLKTELDKQNVSIENVYLGQVDEKGALYVDLYQDRIEVPQLQEHKMTYFTLKKCQSDLELYSYETQYPGAKALFESESQRLETLLEQLKPFLTQ